MSSLNLVAGQFRNGELGINLTVLTDQDDRIMFVGNEVAGVLGYKYPKHAVQRHVDPEDKTTTYEIRGDETSPLTNQYVKTLINEPGLYSLVFSSKLESAKKFKRWVFTDVLPSIRKQGFYALPGAVEAIKAIEPDDVRDLYGKDRREFRRESKALSDICKDSRKVRNGRKGGLAVHEKNRRMKDDLRRLSIEQVLLQEEKTRILEEQSRLLDRICGLEN